MVLRKFSMFLNDVSISICMDGTKYVSFNFLPVSMGSLYNTKFLNILRDSLLVLAEYVLLYSDSKVLYVYK